MNEVSNKEFAEYFDKTEAFLKKYNGRIRFKIKESRNLAWWKGPTEDELAGFTFSLY